MVRRTPYKRQTTEPKPSYFLPEAFFSAHRVDLKRTTRRREDDRENMERPIADIFKPAVDFVKSYYDRLAANAADAADLYREGSLMTIQGQLIRGKEGILAKLTSHPFAGCKRRIADFDCQPINKAGGMIFFANGVLDFVQQDGKQQALTFCQALQLIPTPEGDFYISNDIFHAVAPRQPPQSQVAEGVTANVATAIHT